MNKHNTFPAAFNSLTMIGTIIGVIGLIGSVIGALVDAGNGFENFLHAYIYGFTFWFNLTLGCFGFMLFHNMVRGSWGLPVLRLFEAGAKNIPVMFVLFWPIVFGMNRIYPWADSVQLNASEVLQHRHAWLNPAFFVFRALIYFAVWFFFTNKMTASTRRQDQTGNPAEEQMRANWAPPGFILYILTLTMAVTDWIMSLNGNWYSTIYGALFMIFQGLVSLSFVTLITVLMKTNNREPYASVITKGVTKDFGNLMLMLCMVWAYFSVSQFLIIWSGNLPEEISFYLNRYHGMYLTIAALLIFAQFFGPYLVLLSGKTKSRPNYLWKVALWLICVRVVDLYWNILPAFKSEQTRFNFLAPFPLLAIGGLWLVFFVRTLKANPLLPNYDPRLNEALEHGGEPAAGHH